MALFESYERRIDKINSVLAKYGVGSVEECREICKAAGFDPYEIVKGIQPICFENACWAYCVGAAIALKKNVSTAAEAAEAIGEGLQSFCIPGSVAEDRKVGLGHGNLGAMLLRDETKCFAFLAGHESFAAAEGAIGIVRNANKARKFRFSMPGAQELYMAGIYGTRGGVPCYSILTTAANESMREVHDRMPLVLGREQIDPWLYDLEATEKFLRMTPPQLSKELLDAQVGLW